MKTLQKGDHVYLRDDVRYTTPTGNAVKHFCEAFLVMEWWSDCLHSTRVAKKNVREAGTLRLRPGWADTTSAGAVRPRNSADDSQRPGGPPHKKGEASQLVSAFQAFDSTQRFFPGPYSPGKGGVGLPGLNRNLTRFDFTAFFACQNTSQRCLSGFETRSRDNPGVRCCTSPPGCVLKPVPGSIAMVFHEKILHGIA